MAIKVLSVKDKIKTLITDNEHLRDSDDKLLANIWYSECIKLGIEPPMAFLKAIADSKLSNSESIRRCRQKIQQEYPELRGKFYEERHGLQKEVINDLHQI